MTVSLANVGQTQLGKSGDVKLSELNGNSGDSDATTRIYGTGGGQWPYKRVNSGEVARNEAPDPAATGVGTLSDWMHPSTKNPYSQWIPSDEVGTNMNVTTKICAAASSCRAIFSFDKPNGYDDFHEYSVRQQLFIKLCSDQNTTSQCQDSESEEDDPLTGTAYNPGDGTSIDTGYVSTLQEKKWYIGTVRMQWNDESTPGSYIRDGAGYTAIAQGSMSSLVFNKVDAVVFYMPAAPVCIPNTCGLGSDRATACDRLGFTLDTVYRDATGGLTHSVTVYQSGCGSVISSNFIAFSGYSYPISGGNIDNNPQECGF